MNAQAAHVRMRQSCKIPDYINGYLQMTARKGICLTFMTAENKAIFTPSMLNALIVSRRPRTTIYVGLLEDLQSYRQLSTSHGDHLSSGSPHVNIVWLPSLSCRRV